MLKNRRSYRKLYPEEAYKFAGGADKQTYIQMHASLRPALHAGNKTCTRRTWGGVKQGMQMRAFHNNELVAVTGQGHSSTIGYLRYTSMSTSSVGVLLTDSDLRAEGGTASSDMDFRRRWYRVKDKITGLYVMLPNATVVHVLTFTFYSTTS